MLYMDNEVCGLKVAGIAYMSCNPAEQTEIMFQIVMFSSSIQALARLTRVE